MRPRRHRRGEPRKCGLPRIAPSMLQCGHDVTVVENRRGHCLAHDGYTLLQCGHDVTVVENPPATGPARWAAAWLQCGHDVTVVENAATEDRVMPWGVGFNAATTSPSWRTAVRAA